MSQELRGVVARYVEAVNSFDTDAIVSTFAHDAYVNDNRREIRGTAAVRRWADKEIVGDKVTIEIIELIDHYGDTVLRGRYDGTYDKTNLPEELVLTSYISVRDDRIVSLVIVNNQPSNH